MVLNTMRTVRGWDLDTFLSIPPDQRDEIIKALNEDVNKFLAEFSSRGLFWRLFALDLSHHYFIHF
jgi:hypothetical protein